LPRRQRSQDPGQIGVVIVVTHRKQVGGFVRTRAKGSRFGVFREEVVPFPGITELVVTPGQQLPDVGICYSISAAYVQPRPVKPHASENRLESVILRNLFVRSSA
jgi:hypothetical protein